MIFQIMTDAVIKDCMLRHCICFCLACIASICQTYAPACFLEQSQVIVHITEGNDLIDINMFCSSKFF